MDADTTPPCSPSSRNRCTNPSPVARHRLRLQPTQPDPCNHNTTQPPAQERHRKPTPCSTNSNVMPSPSTRSSNATHTAASRAHPTVSTSAGCNCRRPTAVHSPSACSLTTRISRKSRSQMIGVVFSPEQTRTWISKALKYDSCSAKTVNRGYRMTPDSVPRLPCPPQP